MRENMMCLPAAVLTFLMLPSSVVSHGRLMDPPARNSMWRLGFPNPVNYNDNELYCGGRVTQWARNKGKCGVCGDPHHHPNKEHEVGGKYANGIISRQYTQGDTIDVTVHITANHKGYFEFRICPVTDTKTEVTQECLDKHVLEMVNGEGSRYMLAEGKTNQFFNVSLRLPADMTCKQCVIQWKYRTGNTWDKDDSGKFCVGCGPQEEFYNCADVSINPKHGADKDNKPEQTVTSTDKEKTTKPEKVVQHKKEGIMFTDESFRDKITDYGKQKVEFFQKLQPNDYSIWNEPDKSDLKSEKEVLYSNFVPKVEQPKSQIGSDMRFGYKDTHFEQTSQATTLYTEPSVVTYKWQTGISKNDDLVSIHRRFGYAGTSNQKENGNSWSESQPEQSTASSAMSSDNHNHENEVKHRTDYNNHHTLSNAESQQVLGIHRHDQPKQNNIQKKTSDSRTFGSAAKRLHARLRSVLSNIRLNPHQRDNFLRRWKLLRLRHIAALKALNATSLSRSANTKQQLLTHTQKSKSRSPSQSSSYKDKEITKSMTALTSITPQGKQLNNQQQVRDFWHSSASISQPSLAERQERLDAKESSRQDYLKKNLPSWLIKALRLKHQDTDKYDYDKSGNDGEIGSTTDEIISNLRYDQENKRPKWYNTHGTKKANSQKISSVLQNNLRHNQKTSHKDTKLYDITARKNQDDAAKKTKLQHSLRQEQSSLKMKVNDESVDVQDKKSDANSGEDTESLVRYIVTLLLSRKSGQAADKSADNLMSRSQKSYDPVQATEKAPLESLLKDNRTESYSWFMPGRAEVFSNARTEAQHEGRRDDQRVDTNNQDIQEFNSVLKDTNQMQLSTDDQGNRPPSVRADSQPFKGLILGPDYSLNQGHTRGVIENDWERARTNGEVTNVQRNSFSTNINHAGQNYQQKSQVTNYNKPTQHFQEQAPRSRWSNPLADEVSRQTNDYHHIWAARAQNRQGYYNNQAATTRAPLVCESLVRLGGGMDRWCTDNCNANFCPSSMCVCTSRFSSVYASHRSPLPSQQIVHQWTRPAEAVIDRSMEGMNPRHKTVSDSYIGAGVSSQKNGQIPLYSAGNKISYFKPEDMTSVTRPALAGHTLSTSSQSDGRDNMNSLPLDLIASGRHYFQPSSRVVHSENIYKNMEDSTNTVPYFSPHSETLNRHRTSYIAEGRDHSGIQSPRGSYHSRETRFQSSPFTGYSSINYRLPQYDVKPEVPAVPLSWLTRNNEDNSASQLGERDVIKPYVIFNDQRHVSNGQVSTGETLPHGKNYNFQSATGQSFLGQNQFYPQLVNMKHSNGQEFNPRFRCKAIGPYTGLKHFNEWCDSTCMSTMCPLLICSCES